MNHHPDAHQYVHAVDAAVLHTRARAQELHRAADNDPGRRGTPVRTRLGWLLVETGLRLLHPPAQHPRHSAM